MHTCSGLSAIKSVRGYDGARKVVGVGGGSDEERGRKGESAKEAASNHR
jgi:hypothetical protein